MSIAANSGNPGKECFHLERTRTATSYSPPPALRNESLQEMQEKGLCSKSRLEECTAVNQQAYSEDIDCVFPIFWGEHGLSERYIYFSVYTGQKDNWCKFGRTVCTFDSKTEHPQLLQNAVDTSNEDIEDVEEMISAADDVHQHSRSSIIMETNYFWSSKRIPEDLPVDLTTAEKPVPENFEPLEVQCPYCPGPSPPDLGNKILITR
ncbi:uncharacterized protein LOC107735388, partial [Sinocyclocheilus rhinocerous]|uniref:uncharacterized protein LOC107735388 n=1 Tax=Sinocyclocheilus rhinocerous TaxID=307959 RepID=UPI0007B9935E